jgi:phytanoyl-CoA hydroxylase
VVSDQRERARSSLADQIERLNAEGFVVVPGFLTRDRLDALNDVSRRQLATRAEPLEFEADLQYPGAPASRTAAGGGTVRRLLDAYSRDPAFSRCGTATEISRWMEAYFGESALLSRVHHNCLMTKHPLYGSLTGWHRDIRYWSFQRENLVSVWLALGEEHVDNGALWFVPASHRMTLAPDRHDAEKFFRADRPDNAAVLRSATSPRLEPGDAVLFHCNTLHSAGKNLSDSVKFSLVFTYHGISNEPQPGTRSASRAEIALT